MKQIVGTALTLLGLLSSCSKYQIGHAFFGMPDPKVRKIEFEKANSNAPFTFTFPDTANDLYLKELRDNYKLSNLLEEAKTDKSRALILLEWTNRQWAHNGSNEPSKSNAITILKEAKEGKQFRCVEYGIVATDAMLSVGLFARVLGLKTRDVETCKSSAGHVLAEVWLKEFTKWALVDGQFNIMPICNGIPLNAIEFQEAIVSKKSFDLINNQGIISKKERKAYLQFISHYLYNFDVSFDQRRVIGKEKKYKFDGKSSLMLVPLGAKNPEIFQRESAINHCFYTHSEEDFYKSPTK